MSMRLLVALVTLLAAPLAQAQDEPEILSFFAAAWLGEPEAAEARAEIAARWRDGYAGMIVDLLDLMQRTGAVNPQAYVQLARLTLFLEEQTQQEFGANLDEWRRWVWRQPYVPHPDYGEFKGLLYGQLQPEFAEFFRPPVTATIRLDQIQWGGVGVNGIPPLDHPDHIGAAEADYLDDDNIVFGLVVAGEARAYPKRILAWHELALDRVGERELTIVYCTLCGTVIPFDSQVGGEVRTFGTSGLLYQSNKLMFDAGTRSLWSSLTGRPVVGPLADSDLELTSLPVVTTTWGEWHDLHPETRVLSLNTGHQRDYREGAAYRSYFGTDALMFDVSRYDQRLANKAEVLVLRSLSPTATAHPSRPLAIAADFLAEHPVYHLAVDGTNLVVITSPEGANRVYLSAAHRFSETARGGRVRDATGRAWRVDELALRAEGDPELELPRISAHRAFWFGWYAQHPDTELIN